MSFLAKKREGNEPVQISTISEAENISLKFFESILLSLHQGGIFSIKKGKKDGGNITCWKNKDTRLYFLYWKAPLLWYCAKP
ncbi:MAG: hypothetical protein R2793_01345 [Flavobacteriaceae bacterium]